MQSSADPLSLTPTYEAHLPKLQRLVDEVRFALANALDHTDLKVSITSRVKTIDSFLEKVVRKQYANPLREMTDMAGVRVVCQFTPDLTQVAAALNDLFMIQERVDKTALLGSDRMGYFGTHFIVQLGEKYRGPRYDDIFQLNCEIQVKTILQDAWAQIDHSLMYKATVSIPSKERRDLNNVSSLLEVAQSIFDRTRETREQYAEEVQKKSARPEEFLAQPIDRETVAAYTKNRYPSLPVNHRVQEMLLEQLDHDRYKTLADLDRAVVEASAAVDAYRLEAPNLFKAGTDYITKSLGFVDAAFRKRHGFAIQTRQAFIKFESLLKAQQR
jgi:ppGpp synthetase/RelA/SpoT-type nucleotidyltranferase